MRHVTYIDEHQHWADYAELQKPPRADFRPGRSFWPGMLILFGVALVAYLAWVRV